MKVVKVLLIVGSLVFGYVAIARSQGACRLPGQDLNLPKCTLGSLPEVRSVQSSADVQEDPDMSGEPGTPVRTQSSGTR